MPVCANLFRHLVLFAGGLTRGGRFFNALFTILCALILFGMALYQVVAGEFRVVLYDSMDVVGNEMVDHVLLVVSLTMYGIWLCSGLTTLLMVLLGNCKILSIGLLFLIDLLLWATVSGVWAAAIFHDIEQRRMQKSGFYLYKVRLTF